MKRELIEIFEDRNVRSAWDLDAEKWYISIVDAIEVLTGSPNPRRYRSDLKIKIRIKP